jgi:hypothetical protein
VFGGRSLVPARDARASDERLGRSVVANAERRPVADEQAKAPLKRKHKRDALGAFFRVRWASLLLTALGLAMLALGVFVEDSDVAAAALVSLGPLIVVLGALLELFEKRIVKLVLARLSIELVPPPSANELERAGVPEGVAEALEQWLDDVTRLLPVTIEQQVRETLDARERRRRMYDDFVRRNPPPEHGQVAEPDND